MRKLPLASLLALLMPAAALAEEGPRADALLPVIERPLTLPRGVLSPTLTGSLANWSDAVFGAPDLGSISGEALALDVAYGITEHTQLSLLAAFPIHPGAGFGSLYASAAFALAAPVALRLDLGFERLGLNGETTGLSGSDQTNYYVLGFGFPAKFTLSPMFALVSGTAAANGVSQFRNFGSGSTGAYLGGSVYTEAGSDLFSITAPATGGFVFGINAPVGLLIQPIPQLALTLRTGFSEVIQSYGYGPKIDAVHLVPAGLEAVVTPVPYLDVGASFMFDGIVGESGDGSGNAPGYFAMRTGLLWVRARIGL